MVENSGRDFLVSIRPVHAEKIFGGTKTVELRRKFSEGVAPGAAILIYSTSPTQAIVGSATIASVQKLPLEKLWGRHGEAACVDRDTFDDYFKGLKDGFAILLKDVRPLPSMVAAAELKEKFGFVPPQSFMYLRQEFYHLLGHERVQATN